jgi:glycosyltransferase 2 family protein
LLVFRVLYFVIPFGIAISIMGTREIWLNVVVPWQQRRRLNEGFPSSAPAAATVPRPVERIEPLKRIKSRG